MSIKQMIRVFEDKDLTPTRKLIMLSIADNANDSGIAFPSINTIKNRTNLSNGAVNDNLKWLIENKYLFRKHRSRKKGGRSSNKYLIYPMENIEFLDEDDYIIFEDLFTQIPADGLPTQIPADGQGVDTQIPADGQESEPSLISFNRHLPPKPPKKTNFENFIEKLLKYFESEKILTFRSKINKSSSKSIFRNSTDIEDCAIRFTEYVKRNKNMASRLDKFLLAYYENNISEIEHAQGGGSQAEPGSLEWERLQSLNRQEVVDAELL